MNELIVIKQLPIIEENLKSLSEEIDKKVSNAKALICDESTVKEIKKLRAEFNKEFKELESQRNLVKTEIEKPYKEFEEIYKKYISNKYVEADSELGGKISEVESELKHIRETEVRKYFEELKVSSGIDFIQFVDANIIVNLSTSMKYLKTQCKEFISKIDEDLRTIKTLEHADEIEVEYRKSLNLNQSIQEVTNRHWALDELKRIEESAKETVALEEHTIEKVDEALQAPTESEIIEGQMTIDDFEGKLTENEFLEERKKYIEDINPEDEEVVQVKFVATGKRKDLREVVHLMKERGVIYESITN